MSPLPALWICGPPGVGKTAVAWRIFTEIGRARAVAHVDIDQLGICYPERPEDPGRHRLKARNLGVLATSVAADGVTWLVVSGVIDPIQGPHSEEMGNVDLMLVRLRADPEVLARRLTTRKDHGSEEFDAVMRYAAELDESRYDDLTIDTTELTVREVADRIRKLVPAWPANLRRKAQTVTPSRVRGQRIGGGQVVWLIGARGAGKSTVGWALFQAALASGAGAAFLDLEQIGFVAPASRATIARDKRLASLVAAMWANYREAGGDHLIVVGGGHDTAELDYYRNALLEANLTICRLHAGRESIEERIRRRADGEGPRLPGDALFGASPSRLATIVANASWEAERMERTALGDIHLETDGRSVAEVVAAAMAALRGWPGGS